MFATYDGDLSRMFFGLSPGRPVTGAGLRARGPVFTALKVYKDIFMRRVILILIVVVAVGSCSEPAKITARPDPTAATSGTLGSEKATDGIIPFQRAVLPDSTHGH